MRFTVSTFIALSLVSGALSIGCGGAPPQAVVATRASNELWCPKEQVSVQNIGGTSYKASGCGQTATYTCMGGNFGNPYDAICTREGNPGPASGVTAPQAK
jgi:hypothetical protein